MEATVKPAVLLVEDNRVNQKLMVLMLGKLGIVPAVAGSGEEAIAAVQSGRFDLILMDLHMPGMDGFEAASRIHQQLGEACPVIVALTADTQQSSIEEALSKGMDGYLTKPVSADLLKASLLEHTGYQPD